MSESIEKILSRDLFAAIEPLLKEGKSAVFHVSGMSMWPFLCHKRDSVIIRRADPDKLQVGDIVLMKIPVFEKYVLHRITKIRSESPQIQTTGDGNCERDGWFPADCVMAVVTELERKGKHIPVNAPGYKFLSRLWRWLFPCRKLLLKLLLGVSKIKQAFRKK